MGFEQVPPPLPERQDELRMLSTIEESWLKQPITRYYMQEDVRRAKMEYYRTALDCRRKFLINCCLVSFFTVPLAVWSRRFFVYKNYRGKGIPFMKKLTYFEKNRTVEFERTRAGNKGLLFTWGFTTWILSTVLTDWNYSSDQNYDIFPKVERML